MVAQKIGKSGEMRYYSLEFHLYFTFFLPHIFLHTDLFLWRMKGLGHWLPTVRTCSLAFVELGFHFILAHSQK